MSTAAVAERELVITRVFNAPRALVFKAFADPAHLLKWWGPRHHPAIHVHADVRAGGSWRMCLKSTATGDELWHHGVFREVSPPERLVFTFVWEEEGERGIENLVTIDFAAQGNKTLMTFRHAPFVSTDERDGHSEGWNSTFDRLDDLIAAGD